MCVHVWSSHKRASWKQNVSAIEMSSTPPWHWSKVSKHSSITKNVNRTSLYDSDPCPITHTLHFISTFCAAEDEKRNCEYRDSSHTDSCSPLLNLMRQFKAEVVCAWRCLWSHNSCICCSTGLCARPVVLNVLIHSLNMVLEADKRLGESLWIHELW